MVYASASVLGLTPQAIHFRPSGAHLISFLFLSVSSVVSVVMLLPCRLLRGELLHVLLEAAELVPLEPGPARH